MLFSIEPAKLYFHRPGAFLELNGRMGYKVKQGQNPQMQLTLEDITMLPRHDSRSVDDGTQKRGNCEENRDYDDCMYSTLHRHMMEAAGCVAPWMPSRKDDNVTVSETRCV